MNTWGEFSVDAERGIAYFPHRIADLRLLRRRPARDEPLLDCLLALDARTGKRLWHFQSRTTISGTSTTTPRRS